MSNRAGSERWHGLQGFFLRRLAVKYHGIHLALVSFPYPVGAGRQLFDFHCIILLKKVYKNNTQTDFLVDWMLPEMIQYFCEIGIPPGYI